MFQIYFDTKVNNIRISKVKYFTFLNKCLFTKVISKRTVLTDVQGNTMPAIDVFSAGIRYLKDKMFEKCKDEVLYVIEADIQWVITVPAIWNDKAKAFMREAAIQVCIMFADVHTNL